MSGHVVGVVRDVETVLGEPSLPKVYLSLERVTVPGMSVTARAIADAAAIVPSVRAEIRAVDPNVLLEDVTVVEQSVQTSVAPQRFNMLLVISFAALALALAAIGIYGVTAFSVATRRNEIGIRRALGASDHRVALEVIKRVGVLTASGIVFGLIGAASAGRLLSSLLVGVSPSDPAILAGVAALLAAISGGAAAVPVLRAMHIDPTESLGSD